MSCITRGILRWGLIGALALGGVTLLVGPQRVAMGLSQVRVKAQSMIESCVDDPIALRRQLEELADEYPDRIAEVRGELAEVEHQIGQIDRDCEIAGRVIAMTTEDLTEMKTLVTRAQDQLGRPESDGRAVFIRFEGARFDIDAAHSEAVRINNVRQTYKDRLAMDRQQLSFLQEQKARLAEILGKLEADFSTYQSQLWQLDRQIDAIERNERLIELTKEQQATLESYERFGKVANLGQIQAKLAELRTIQEAQLQQLANHSNLDDYEERAKMELDAGDSDDPFFGIDQLQEKLEEIADEAEGIVNSTVWNDPIVIE